MLFARILLVYYKRLSIYPDATVQYYVNNSRGVFLAPTIEIFKIISSGNVYL